MVANLYIKFKSKLAKLKNQAQIFQKHAVKD